MMRGTRIHFRNTILENLIFCLTGVPLVFTKCIPLVLYYCTHGAKGWECEFGNLEAGNLKKCTL
jgi:hypothetical protein